MFTQRQNQSMRVVVMQRVHFPQVYVPVHLPGRDCRQMFKNKLV